MTPSDDALVRVIEALEGAGIPHMIVGSLAANFHGIPRSTRDADFVVELQPGSLRRLEQLLPVEMALDPQSAFEGVTGTIRHIIHLRGSAFVCELFELSDDPHDRERFSRRQATRLLGARSFVATAEDMVVTKLRWASGGSRSKDRDDVRNIVAVQGDSLDWDYLTRWTSAHGTSALLAEIRASISG